MAANRGDGSGNEGVTVGANRATRGDDTPRGTHTPVLLARCLELIAPALTGPDPIHVDATLGLGGHAEAVLAAHPTVTLIGLDRDPTALERSERRLSPYAGRTHLVHAVFDELSEVLSRIGTDTVDSVLFDLGVSSMQLDLAERGFAYSQDAPLDMRMDPTRGITAEEVVNSYDIRDLTRILRVYGEERFAHRVATAIVAARGQARITSSARLAELVRDAIPAAARRTGGNPAKRSFQALRIEVNGELAALETALPAAVDALAPGGRVVVLSYHSLEDRIVKREFAARAASRVPVDLPVDVPELGPQVRLLTRGAEQASEAEVAANPRAASVRLRAAERLDPRPPGRSGPALRQTSGPRKRAGRKGEQAEAPHTNGARHEGEGR